MQMILETVYSSQTKLIGPNLDISEHGIGYLNLPFAAIKAKKADVQFQVLETPGRTRNSELEHRYKKVSN